MEPARKRARLGPKSGSNRVLVKRVLEETVVRKPRLQCLQTLDFEPSHEWSNWENRVHEQHLRLHRRDLDFEEPEDLISTVLNAIPAAETTVVSVIGQIIENPDGQIVASTVITSNVQAILSSLTQSSLDAASVASQTTEAVAPTTASTLPPDTSSMDLSSTPQTEHQSPHTSRPSHFHSPVPTSSNSDGQVAYPTSTSDLAGHTAAALPLPSLISDIQTAVAATALPSSVRSAADSAVSQLTALVPAAVADGAENFATTLTANLPQVSGLIVAASISADLTRVSQSAQLSSGVVDLSASFTAVLSIGRVGASDGLELATGRGTILAVSTPTLSPLATATGVLPPSDLGSSIIATAEGLPQTSGTASSAATILGLPMTSSNQQLPSAPSSMIALPSSPSTVASTSSSMSTSAPSSLSSHTSLSSQSGASSSSVTASESSAISSVGISSSFVSSGQSATTLISLVSPTSSASFQSISTLSNGMTTTFTSPSGAPTESDGSLPTGAGSAGHGSGAAPSSSSTSTAGAGSIESQASSAVPVPTVVGGVVGGIAGVAIIFIVFVVLFRYHRKRVAGKAVTAGVATGAVGGATTRGAIVPEMQSSAGLGAPFIAAAAMARRWRPKSGTAELSAGPSTERSFVRVAGRKLAPGGDGYGGGYDDNSLFAGSSFLRPDSAISRAPPSRGIDAGLAAGPSVRQVPPGSSASTAPTSSAGPSAPYAAAFPEVRDSLDMFSDPVPSPPPEARLSDGEGFWMRPGPGRQPETGGSPIAGAAPFAFATAPRTPPRFGPAGQNRLGMSHHNGSRTSRFSENVD